MKGWDCIFNKISETTELSETLAVEVIQLIFPPRQNPFGGIPD